eukprot:jgi/Ulvmu1/8947/UM005_0038.1
MTSASLRGDVNANWQYGDLLVCVWVVGCSVLLLCSENHRHTVRTTQNDPMDATLKNLEQHCKEQRCQQSTASYSRDSTFEHGAREQIQDVAVASELALDCWDQLPFQGNPLDRSAAKQWAQANLPAVIKAKQMTWFLPVNGRSVFCLKQTDKKSKLQTFSLFWLSSEDFLKLKNQCFPEASTHLLGKSGTDGWRFVASLNDGDDNVLLQLKKFQPQLCTADMREMTLTATREDLAIAGQAVALVRWHQVHQFCPQCGSPAVPAVLGTVRRCTMEEEHLLRPQVTPVVVVLLQSPDRQQALLARTHGMRPCMVNCLSTHMHVCEGVAEVAKTGLEGFSRCMRSQVCRFVGLFCEYITTDPMQGARDGGCTRRRSSSWPLLHGRLQACTSERVRSM